MTVEVTYDVDNLPPGTTDDSSIKEILDAYDSAVEQGSHSAIYGTFGGGGAFDGTSYTYYDPSTGYSFEVDGNLNYYFPPLNGSEGQGPQEHTLWGELDSVTLGSGETSGNKVANPFITFDFEPGITGDVSEGRSNDVHDVIWGLMNGSTEGATDSAGTQTHGGLQNALTAEGLDLNAPLSSGGESSDLNRPDTGLPDILNFAGNFIEQYINWVASFIPAASEGFSGVASQQLADSIGQISSAAV